MPQFENELTKVQIDPDHFESVLNDLAHGCTFKLRRCILVFVIYNNAVTASVKRDINAENTIKAQIERIYNSTRDSTRESSSFEDEMIYLVDNDERRRIIEEIRKMQDKLNNRPKSSCVLYSVEDEFPYRQNMITTTFENGFGGY
jgi:hypothetical protein